jgi:hypothetical protein
MKNFYALNAGEFFVAQEILKHRKDLQLYFPLKDVGIDLLAIKPTASHPVSIQVKESRTYEGRASAPGFSWHQIRNSKIKDADVFVFISYIPVIKGSKTAFDMDFVVIPRKDLTALCGNKKAGDGKYSFYFARVEGKLFDLRDGRLDVSAYHRAWNLI